MTSALAEADTELRDRLVSNFPVYAEEFLQIVDKRRRRVPFVLKPAQVLLHDALEAQRRAGTMQRAIVCKSRQVGYSTFVQGKLIQRATLMPNHNAVVVAHDAETAGKLYLIGERMYSGLPPEPEWLKPEIRSWRRARFLHFGEKGSDAWMDAAIYPDSTYFTDTAGEFQAGRGATYHSIHASELGWWPQPEEKFTGLMQTLPDGPESLVVIESTPNGHNFFKDIWDDAYQGRSDFAAIFWPWWKEPEYRQPFANEAEREGFTIGGGHWGEEEPALRELLLEEGLGEDEIAERLHWRRQTIANKLGGKADKFKQEYPSTPEDGFLSTGARVFDGSMVSRLIRQVEATTDPRLRSEKGPTEGQIRPTKTETRAGRAGAVEVPLAPEFVPRSKLGMFESPDWRVWELPESDEEKGERQYVVGADVSSGITESEEEGADPAYHAMQVIDHLTKEQVCEYRARCDPDLFASHVLLTAELYNQAWVAVEVTGGWGWPVIRKLAHDFRYPYKYRRKKHDRSNQDKPDDRLGWDTTQATKPILVAGGQELLREGSHGIRSRRLALEMLTYAKLKTGKMVPEPGKFADLLMAWLIAQQVALEMPVRPQRKKAGGPRLVTPRDPISGY